jgi:hypothetical protein
VRNGRRACGEPQLGPDVGDLPIHRAGLSTNSLGDLDGALLRAVRPHDRQALAGDVPGHVVPNVDDPDALADHLTLVFEGAYASTQALGAAGPAGQARNVAQALIDTATPISP